MLGIIVSAIIMFNTPLLSLSSFIVLRFSHQ